MYQHGKRTSRPKDKKIVLKASIIIGAALIVAAWLLQKDLNLSDTSQPDKAIITEVKENAEETIKIDEPLFSMNLPADWELKMRVNEHYRNSYEWRATKEGANDRTLILFIDIMPEGDSSKVTRLLPLTVDGNKFILGNISEHCINFATEAGPGQPSSNAPVEAKWENVIFVCDPIEANQTIGTGTEGSGIASRMGEHKFHFYWRDHNVRPDDRMFRNIVSSFVAK